VRSTPSKLLLFGEYAILDGGDALAVPLFQFAGEWTYEQPNAQGNLMQLAQDQRLIDLGCLDLTNLKSDLLDGRWIKSNIPSGYGIGSSGVVTALIYAHYRTHELTDLRQIKGILAAIESFFHGKSSGIDPLTSFMAKPIYVQMGGIVSALESIQRPPLCLGLLNSKRKRASTESLVAQYKTRSAESPDSAILVQAIKECQLALTSFCTQTADNEMPALAFIENLRQLSVLQLKLFEGEWIPNDIADIWRAGIETDSGYIMKLCGAGGGGFFQVWSTAHITSLGGYDVCPINLSDFS
jgi:mevalonate kinase